MAGTGRGTGAGGGPMIPRGDLDEILKNITPEQIAAQHAQEAKLLAQQEAQKNLEAKAARGVEQYQTNRGVYGKKQLKRLKEMLAKGNARPPPIRGSEIMGVMDEMANLPLSEFDDAANTGPSAGIPKQIHPSDVVRNQSGRIVATGPISTTRRNAAEKLAGLVGQPRGRMAARFGREAVQDALQDITGKTRAMAPLRGLMHGDQGFRQGAAKLAAKARPGLAKAVRQAAPAVAGAAAMGIAKAASAASGPVLEAAFPNMLQQGEPAAVEMQERVRPFTKMEPEKVQQMLALDQQRIEPEQVMDVLLGASDDAGLADVMTGAFSYQDALAYQELRDILDNPMGVRALDFAFNSEARFEPENATIPSKALMDKEDFLAAGVAALPGAGPVTLVLDRLRRLRKGKK